LLVCFLFLSSCSKPYVTDDELQHYIMDRKNGLIKTIVKGNISATLFYRPAELIMGTELKSKGLHKSPNEIDTRYQDYAYFILRLSRNNEDYLNEFARKQELYPEAVSYFSERIKNDLLLSCDKTKVTPEVVALIQSFGISDYTDVMVAFRTEGLQERENFKITLSDSEFVPGFYEFTFRAKEIRCVPLLNPLSYEVI
jgi:hypothetical protein